ncbi:hypothetical protein QBC32DRAFT_179585, partial [Pseudoneurospora amorphoporcata]
AQQTAFDGWLSHKGQKEDGIGLETKHDQRPVLFMRSAAKLAKGLDILGVVGLYPADLATWYFSATVM